MQRLSESSPSISTSTTGSTPNRCGFSIIALTITISQSKHVQLEEVQGINKSAGQPQRKKGEQQHRDPLLLANSNDFQVPFSDELVRVINSGGNHCVTITGTEDPANEHERLYDSMMTTAVD
ncbi:hypothetical protein DAPPUDRAFT_124457, partial [Daphnia pulex]